MRFEGEIYHSSYGFLHRFNGYRGAIYEQRFSIERDLYQLFIWSVAPPNKKTK